MRRLLIISKAPEFDGRNEVVLGQCEPFTTGWDLLLFSPIEADSFPGLSRPEKLLSGSYNDLRRIQDACSDLEHPDDVRKRVTEMKALSASSVLENAAADFAARREDGADSTKILEPTKTDLMPSDPTHEETVSLEAAPKEEFFALRTQDGAVIATVGSYADEVAVLKIKLNSLLDSKPRALVVDLEQLPNMAVRAARDLLNVRERCLQENIGFALCGVRKTVRKLLSTLLEGKEAPLMLPNAADALAVLFGQTDEKKS
jgi:anti-anti-sigma regulatory factor